MRLRELREQKSMTQQEVADATGIDRALYGRYENGTRTPPLPNLKILAAFFDVTIDYLVSEPDTNGVHHEKKEAAIAKKQLSEEEIMQLPLAKGAVVNKPKRKSVLKDEDSVMFAAHSDDDEDPMDDNAHEELKLIIEDVLREHGIIKDKKKK